MKPRMNFYQAAPDAIKALTAQAPRPSGEFPLEYDHGL